MTYKVYETIIIGAGISGLACARRLQKFDKDFLIISKDIGGRILTSDDGFINYGAFFVCSDYQNVLKFVKLKSRIKLRDFCFHNNNQIYVLFEPKLLIYLIQFIKILKIQFKFRRALRRFRKISENISQKKAIENDSFLKDLYMKKATDFVKENNIQSSTDTYLSKGLYSTTFSSIEEMNTFSFLQFLLQLITPIYTFDFEKEKMIEPFKEKILLGCVSDINFKNEIYKIKLYDKTYYSKNIVLATQISWSKNFANIKKINKSVNTNMLHIKGFPRDIFSKKFYHLFTPFNEVQAIADLNNGTYLFYYRDKRPNLKSYFTKYQIISHHFWNPAGTINGHNLIESNRGNNMYLIGDYNIAGLEESYISGLYAANQIIQLNQN
jgi:hypothetical protein